LKSQAAFAYADAVLPSTNAIQIFYDIAADPASTNTPIAARAWGRLGDCYYMMNGDATIQAATNAAARDLALQRYQKATNYFQIAMQSPQADVVTRSSAEIRLGQTLDAMARLEPENRKELYKEALGHFWGVFYESNLRDNEQADVSCLKDAGLEAGKLAGEMGEWDQARKIYQKLMKLMPPLQTVLEKKIAYADEQANASAVSADKNK
jgi:tetratricopeptide (TPR) repeat protein